MSTFLSGWFLERRNVIEIFILWYYLRKKEPSSCFSNSIEDRFKFIADFVESEFLYLNFRYVLYLKITLFCLNM